MLVVSDDAFAAGRLFGWNVVYLPDEMCEVVYVVDGGDIKMADSIVIIMIATGCVE